MIDLVKVAKKYIDHGFSVIPVSPITKIPVVRQWGRWQVAPMTHVEIEEYFKDARSIALLTGGRSRVVALDADMKYDLSGDLWERFKQSVPVKILRKCMCQSTQNKGYHLVFIAPASRLEGNCKLACRYTTPEEKHLTYLAILCKAPLKK